MFRKLKNMYLKNHLGAFGENSLVPLKGMRHTYWKNIFVGENVSIGPGCSLGATKYSKIVVKDGAILAPGVTILTRSHNYDSPDLMAIPYDEVNLAGDVIIEEAVWIGQNVTIVGGVTVAKGAVIGTGSVITKSIPAYAVVVGNPAKIIKYRDRDRFEELLVDQKFSRNNLRPKTYVARQK